ncbi:MAG: TfoX/Sxy family protein [Rhizobiaceae bacterium]
MSRAIAMLHSRLDPLGAVAKRMFGGSGFMLNGNMAAGTFRDGVLFRAGPGFSAIASARAEARPMTMGERVAAGYWIVAEPALDAATFDFWLDAALAFNATLPAKEERATRRKMARKNA